MTSENCRKEAKAEANIKGKRHCLLPFMTGVMEVTVTEEKVFRKKPRLSTNLESIVIQEASKAIKRNKGAPGIDRMKVEELEIFF